MATIDTEEFKDLNGKTIETAIKLDDDELQLTMTDGTTFKIIVNSKMPVGEGFEFEPVLELE